METMEKQTNLGALAGLSAELASVVEQVGPSVVRVDDGTRLSATGLLWGADGVVLATSHGVERDEEIVVELADGARLPATLVGRDPDTDLAVLRIQATGLPAVTLADADAVKVGHLVLALGRPGGSGLQATLGIISARIDSQTNGQSEYVLYTDADLYPGFSGGPLADVQGRVVGISNLAFGRGRGVAIGVSVASHVVETILAHGRVQRGYLGVGTQVVPLPAALRSALNLESEIGVLVLQVSPNGPAEKGGVMLGDILLRVNDQPVVTVDDLRQRLRQMNAGQAVTLHVARGGELRTLTVTLGTDS
jgi:S1-C subfamily serine protease